MGYAMRKIQHYIALLREAWNKRINLSLSTIRPNASKSGAVCLPRSPPLLKPDNTGWKATRLSDNTTGCILVLCYDDQ